MLSIEQIEEFIASLPHPDSSNQVTLQNGKFLRQLASMAMGPLVDPKFRDKATLLASRVIAATEAHTLVAKRNELHRAALDLMVEGGKCYGCGADIELAKFGPKMLTLLPCEHHFVLEV